MFNIAASSTVSVSASCQSGKFSLVPTMSPPVNLYAFVQ